jgi:HlyD family secretion protein
MRKIIRYSALIVFIIIQISVVGCRKGAADGNQTEISGLIEAVKTDVRAQAQGEIEQLPVKEGQKVAKGDLLCVLNADKLRLQIEQEKAAIAASEAKFRLAKIGTKKELIAVAKTQVETAAKQLELAQKDQERMANLLKEGAVSISQKEKADLALKAAQDQHKNAQENYQMAFRGREKEEFGAQDATAVSRTPSPGHRGAVAGLGLH